MAEKHNISKWIINEPCTGQTIVFIVHGFSVLINRSGDGEQAIIDHKLGRHSAECNGQAE